MSVETKKRNVENSLKLKEIGKEVASLLNNLNNLVMWWYTNYSEQEDNTSTMPYMMHRYNFDSDEVKIATLEPSMFQRLFYVITDKPFINQYDDLEGWICLFDIANKDYGNLSIYLLKRKNSTVYLLKRKDTSVLGVSDVQMSQNTPVFEYPPRSFASILFFMVNPEVEKYLRNLSKEYLHSNEDLYTLDTWEYVYDRVRETKIERDIEHPKKHEYRNDVNSSLNVSGSQRYRLLSSISTCTISSGENLQQYFTVEMKKGEHILEYYMTNEIEMSYLLRRLLPRSDIVNLLNDVSSLLPSIRKIPALVKVLEQLDDEWFTKPVNHFSEQV
ncbi:MAG: hypothetical protein QXK07_04295 [Desulfurococcaceae archaeon]